MVSLRLSFVAWIFVGFLISLSHGAGNTTQLPTTTLNTTNIGMSVSPNVTASLHTGNTTSNQTEIQPSFVVRSMTDVPCVLATFNVTIRVSYYVKTHKSKHRYIAFTDVVVPPNADSEGYCGENVTSLVLTWGNDTFNLNLTFSSYGNTKESTHGNWTLDQIVFGYNLSNYHIFPAAVEAKYVSVNASGLQQFPTHIGHTLECDKLVKLELGKDERGAEITFQFAKIATFNLTSTQFPSEVDECTVISNTIREEDFVVPLIIACCLSFVIIVVVIAYAISRKVQEARDQTLYKPMP